MKRKDQIYCDYIAILKQELVPAMGCTEPICIAYACAKARDLLDLKVDRIHIEASGNIIKNVKSVTVPHTGGRKGIAAAAAIGVCAGDSSADLEVIAHVLDDQFLIFEDFMEQVPITIDHLKSDTPLELIATVYHGDQYASVHIKDQHSHIVDMVLNGQKQPISKRCMTNEQAIRTLSIADIYTFAMMVDIEDIKDVMERQVSYNKAIAEEGLQHGYGADIANVLLKTYGDSVQIKARAYAAAGSDARMSGCELPVIINSGSGNQGITASMPVYVYAKEYTCSDDQLYRALVISNLATLYQKQQIGRLSAYCGAVSAGAAAGAGIAYLLGGDYEHICHTIVNALAITSGIFCDGAKPSCAAKIATAVDAGIMGCMMFRNGHQFYHGEGIVGCSIDDTMNGVGCLARDGMKSCDEEIIRLMIKDHIATN